jgi:putative glutamine transport system permease protein
MSFAKIGPLLDRDIWRFLLGGLALTVEAALAAIVLSVLAGTLLAMCRLSRIRLLSLAAAGYVETIRSLPVFLILIYVYFGIYRLAFELPTVAAIVLGLTIYHTAKNAEIIRAGIQSIAKGQIEAAQSQGMTYLQIMIHIVFPQAFRRMIPPLVSELILCLKNTSIGSVVGFNEILRRGTIVYQQYLNPIEMLLVVALIYWILCYGLSRVSRHFEAGAAQKAERRFITMQATLSTPAMH